MLQLKNNAIPFFTQLLNLFKQNSLQFIIVNIFLQLFMLLSELLNIFNFTKLSTQLQRIIKNIKLYSENTV